MNSKQGMYYIVPALLFVLIIFGIPMIVILYSSVTYNDSLTFVGFKKIFSSPAVWWSLYNTLEISFVASILAGIAGYLVAFHIASKPPRQRAFYMAIVLIPFWTSILVKSFAFTIILGYAGLVNGVLRAVDESLVIQLLYNRIGVYIGMVNFLIPFVVFPVLSNLVGQDKNIVRAAELMGASPWQTFLKVTLPASRPAIAAAFLITMILSLGMLITPALLGGRRDVMIAQMIDFYTREVLDWQSSSILALTLLVPTLLMIRTLFRIRAGSSLL